MNELQKIKLENAIYNAAHSSLGIYCKTLIKVDGTRVERTAWQDGWNAAIIESSKNINRIHNSFKMMSDDELMTILELIECDVLEIQCDNNGLIVMYLNVNDTFCYASCDAEEVASNELSTIHRLWKKFGNDGVVAWVAINRNIDPLDELKTEKYTLAVKDIQQLK